MKFVVREFEINRLNSTENVIGIGILDSYGITFPSPLSNFIKSEYRNKGNSLNSQKNAAHSVTRFLNYLAKEINEGRYFSLKQEGIKQLTLQHAADYITELSLKTRTGELTSDYVNNIILYLNKFYLWLLKQEIISEQIKLKYQKINIGNKITELEKNLFESNDLDIMFPKKNNYNMSNLKDFGKNRNRLIMQFLSIAKQVEPILTLGIALQFFAGLRRSEVINLKKNNFQWNNNNLIIQVRDNQDMFNLKDTSDLQVKNPRDQICMCIDIVKPLYEEHLKILSSSKKNISEAMFISSRNFEALSGKSYSRKFEKIKQSFLNMLIENNYVEDYLLLVNNEWSTHIGRGVFTNILLDLGLTSTQIQLARGDRSRDSADSYVDEFTLYNSMNLAINSFSELIDT